MIIVSIIILGFFFSSAALALILLGIAGKIIGGRLDLS